MDHSGGADQYFAWEYLECGTGDEEAVTRNKAALSQLHLVPRFLKGALVPDVSVDLFGRRYEAPIGVAPVGMTGLIWPGGEILLARMASEMGIPFCLSTVAAETLETIGPLTRGNGWFQLYPARRREIVEDLINRASDSSFEVLVVTIDVPLPSNRERQKRAGLTVPPNKSAMFWWRILTRPAWALATLRHGEPRFRTLERYASKEEMQNQSDFFARELCGDMDWGAFRNLRNLWKGPLVLKGILSAEDARLAVEFGADGVWVSNHGGRQFDGAPGAIDCLLPIRDAVGADTKLIFDSGVRSGLDIVRAIREGADFVFCGRPFVYGVAAFRQQGATHAANILINGLRNAMVQLGCRELAEIRSVALG